MGNGCGRCPHARSRTTPHKEGQGRGFASAASFWSQATLLQTGGSEVEDAPVRDRRWQLRVDRWQRTVIHDLGRFTRRVPAPVEPQSDRGQALRGSGAVKASAAAKPAVLPVHGRQHGISGCWQCRPYLLAEEQSSNHLCVVFTPRFEELDRCDDGFGLGRQELGATVGLRWSFVWWVAVLMVDDQRSTVNRRASVELWPLSQVAH